MTDRRDMADSIRRQRQWFIESEIENEGRAPDTQKVVCSSCHGHGKYVNPAIDSHGISVDEFYEDPEFAGAYMSGVYDVRCDECQGENVVDEFSDPEVQDRWMDWLNSMYEDARTQRAESGYYY